ncbi:hypothetical protein B0H19DRAFT_412194 [Mycena capillaripes]|nr:hypothetical protein B0H19DRAFT_412194 [Mycena capillaripes]
MPRHQHEALMSDINDQLAAIKILLQEQAEDCAQQAKYEQERREIADKQRAETDAIEAEVRENLKKILDKREEVLSQEKPIESALKDGSFDVLLQLIKENYESQMSMIEAFIRESSRFQHQQRTILLQEIARLQKKA